MNTAERLTETREVSGFDQLIIRGSTCNALLHITQGNREALVIEAPPDSLSRIQSQVRNGRLTIRLGGSWLQELEDAIRGDINRPRIVYYLSVRDLTRLEVQCAQLVQIGRLRTPRLVIRFNGAGDFRLSDLMTETLEVHLSGTGVMRLSGQVERQTVVMTGTGSFVSPSLESQVAYIRLTGTGLARVRVNQALEVRLRGIGTVEYSGNPIVRTHVTGPGWVRHLTADSG